MDGKKKRINFYISDVQQERMEELCRLHGHASVNQCAKFLLQRGLIVECSSAGIINTNDKLEEMLDIMKTEIDENSVSGLSSTATESQVWDKTKEIEFSEDVSS